MNAEQAKSSVRWLVATFGGAIAGFFAGRGWVSAETVTSLLTSETFISIAASLAVFAWGLVTHTQKNAVAVVADIAAKPDSPVKGIVTTNTPEGVELASAIPQPTIVPAGTKEAADIAKPGT